MNNMLQFTRYSGRAGGVPEVHLHTLIDNVGGIVVIIHQYDCFGT